MRGKEIFSSFNASRSEQLTSALTPFLKSRSKWIRRARVFRFMQINVELRGWFFADFTPVHIIINTRENRIFMQNFSFTLPSLFFWQFSLLLQGLFLFLSFAGIRTSRAGEFPMNPKTLSDWRKHHHVGWFEIDGPFVPVSRTIQILCQWVTSRR